jgi:hypothetical protein
MIPLCKEGSIGKVGIYVSCYEITKTIPHFVAHINYIRLSIFLTKQYHIVKNVGFG